MFDNISQEMKSKSYLTKTVPLQSSLNQQSYPSLVFAQRNVNEKISLKPTNKHQNQTNQVQAKIIDNMERQLSKLSIMLNQKDKEILSLRNKNHQLYLQTRQMMNRIQQLEQNMNQLLEQKKLSIFKQQELTKQINFMKNQLMQNQSNKLESSALYESIEIQIKQKNELISMLTDSLQKSQKRQQLIDKNSRNNFYVQNNSNSNSKKEQRSKDKLQLSALSAQNYELKNQLTLLKLCNQQAIKKIEQMSQILYLFKQFKNISEPN